MLQNLPKTQRQDLVKVLQSHVAGLLPSFTWQAEALKHGLGFSEGFPWPYAGLTRPVSWEWVAKGCPVQNPASLHLQMPLLAAVKEQVSPQWPFQTTIYIFLKGWNKSLYFSARDIWNTMRNLSLACVSSWLWQLSSYRPRFVLCSHWEGLNL